MSMAMRNIGKQIDAGFIKVEYISRNRHMILKPWLNKLLLAIGCPNTYVTEDLMISDLYGGRDCKEEVEEIAKKFNVNIKPYNKVMDIANKIRLQS